MKMKNKIEILKIAVQKSDRISQDFLELLKSCGLSINGTQKKLYCKLEELPIELYFFRGNDIPSLLENKFDLAVLGKDSFFEYKLSKKTKIVKNLGLSKCHLSFAGKEKSTDFELKKLNNKTIATTYSNILQDFLKENNIKAKIIKMNGSVETSIELGVADYIFDIVQTGSTLIQQGLNELKKVIDLEAVLIAKNTFSSSVLTKLLTRIDAVQTGKQQKYVMFNIKKTLLNKVIKILPSVNSPTVLNLANSNYVAIHTLCCEKDVWDLCEKLRQNGAEGIIVSSIDLMF